MVTESQLWEQSSNDSCLERKHHEADLKHAWLDGFRLCGRTEVKKHSSLIPSGSWLAIGSFFFQLYKQLSAVAVTVHCDLLYCSKGLHHPSIDGQLPYDFGSV